MSSFQSGLEMFQHFERYFDADKKVREDIRDVIKDLEVASRQINSCLDVIHLPKLVDIASLKSSTSPTFTQVTTHYRRLKELVPAAEYYKYHESWKQVTQQIVSKLCLLYFMEHKALLEKEAAAAALGISGESELVFHLCLEDYLIGVLCMATELSRFTVNRVTAKDYNTPLEVATFVRELEAGFRMLNLKNDFLRKRYDALKYDVKKIEEVVYDVTLRGLTGA